MSSELWSNDYGSAAGPGAKRRIAQTAIVRERLHKKPDYKADRKPRKDAQEAPTITARSLRQKIIELTLQIGSFGDIVDRLEREAYGPASKVLVSNIRDHTLTVLRVAMAEGLITQKALDRYRADAKEAQRQRFKRRD